MNSGTMTGVERTILAKAIQKLNEVYTQGRGQSLTEDETTLFNYWKERGKVRVIGPARFGEIYAMVEE